MRALCKRPTCYGLLFLGVILGLGYDSFAADDEPARGDDKQGSKPKTKLTAAAYKKLVESLGNRNEPPKIIGRVPAQDALFKADYKWDEQERLLDTIATLIEGFEQHWPVLLEFLDDKRYCITFQHDMSVRNYSVGSICNVILEETFTAAHMEHCPGERGAFLQLSRPDPIRTPDLLKSWGREQRDKGRPLCEIQVQFCEWAIETIPELQSVQDEEKREAVGDIQSQIKELRRTKKPVAMKGIVLIEFRWPYSPERAEQIRAREGEK